MKRYITAFVVFTMLFFSTISIVKAEDCIEIPGDIVETHLNVQLSPEDIARGSKVVQTGLVKATIKIDKNPNPDGSYNAEVVGNFLDNNIDTSTAMFGKEAYQDTRDSENHKGSVKYNNLPDNFFGKDFKQTGNEFTAKATTSKGDTEASNVLEDMAEAKRYAEKNKQPWDANKWVREHTSAKPPQKAFYNNVKWGNKTPEAMEKEALAQKRTPQFAIHTKVQRPPTKVCKGDPGWDLCERFASMPDPSPRTCYNGTFTPSKGACKAYTKDIPISSYTTTSPMPTQPLTRGEDLCRKDDKNQLTFETSVTLKEYAGRMKVNQTNMQDKIPSLVTQYNEDLWTSKYQKEDRFWNPFQEGVISSGLPVDTENMKYYTVELDSWEDREYRPNSFLTESVEYVRKKEAINDTVVKKYHGSNINIYNNAPNPKVTHRYLDGKVWKDLYSTNIECGMRYELLVEPRYKIIEHIRYQHKQVREIYNRQRVSSYDCYPYTCTKTRKTGTQHWSERRQEYVDDYEWYETTCYHTCCELVDDNQIQEWNDGETQTSHEAGEIPPVYAPRVKWRYRIGVGNEYHASAKRLTDKAKLTPVPNSKDTQKMKSGYGFKYSGDKWKIVTDYDEPQFKNESDVIRPNKNVALTLRGNIKSQTEYFDSNVKYNSAKNAPERSSSKDSRYIEERIKANKIKSDFNKNAISKFVSKTKDDSSLLRIRPYTKDSSVSGEKIIYRGKAINMETQFESQSDPNKYYHAYWITKGEPNLIPAYKQAPLHYVHLDYPSGTMYDIYSINRTYIRNGFTIDAYNTGSIKIVGNMWEDSFSRPNFKK